MCCFSGRVASVSNTNIFARMAGNTQYLVYEMKFSADAELAMILPLPVVPGSGEDAVEFISFDGYPDFFKDLTAGFALPMNDLDWGIDSPPLRPLPAPLKVHEVGAFEASFVPSPKDFSRLAPRFRIPENVWAEIPEYADFGFAVFKLRPGSGQKVHPLAFSFQSRHPHLLFFPTLHIHDGGFHSRADYDHMLYCQVVNPGRSLDERWKTSREPAKDFLEVHRTSNLVEGEMPCHQLRLAGMADNQDCYVEV